MKKGVTIMQIKNLEIKDFKAIKELKMNSKKVNVVVGSIGTGKTSTLDALRYLLTGDVPSRPVRSGAENASVRAEIFGIPFERTYGIKSTVKLNGKVTTQKSVKELIESRTHITLDTIKIATTSKFLSAMSSGELSNYLVNNNLIPAEIDFNILKNLCEMSKPVEAELSMTFPSGSEKFNLNTIDEVYKQYYAERRLLKQKLEDEKAKANFMGKIPTENAAAIDEELKRIDLYHESMIAYQKLKQAYDYAVKNRNDILQKMQQIENQIAAIPNVSVDPKEMEYLKGQEKILKQNFYKEKGTIEILMKNIQMFEKTLQNLNTSICPLSDKLVCTIDKTAIKDELQQFIQQNQAEIMKANERKQSICAQAKILSAKMKDYENRFIAVQNLNSLRQQYSNLRSAVPTIPEPPQKPVEIPNQEERKAQLLAQKEMIMRYHMVVQAKKEVEQISERLGIYQEIINLLSPKSGIREKIIEIALSPLIEHANQRAGELKMGLKINIVVNNGVHIMYSPSHVDNDLLPISSASGGESIHILFLILDALNALCGLGIMILDSLEKLDESGLKDLLELFSKEGVLDQYDHIFIAMSNHKDSLELIDKYKGSVIDNIICV